MKFSAVAAITNNLVAARFWMILAILFAGMAVASPYFTAMAMRAREKVVILDPGGTLIYAPLLGFEEAGELHAYHVRLACLALLQRNPVGPDLPDLMKRLYLEPARKKAATMHKARNPEFKDRQIHQKVEVTKIDILDTRQTQGRRRPLLRGGDRAHRRQSHPNRHAQQNGVSRAVEVLH